MCTGQKYGSSESGATPIEQPATTTAPRSSVKTFFSLEISTKAEERGPTEYDIIFDALVVSQKSAMKELEHDLLAYSEGRGFDPVDLKGALEYGAVGATLEKLKNLNTLIEYMGSEVSTILYEYEKEVNRA
ncbi:hypothetical protein GCM10027423_62180 [Spirosoma arcticum]